MKPYLYLDMDGVLADFDTRATEILGMDSYKFEFMFGTEEFWRRLDVPDLFLNFDPKPDMEVLWRGVAHLNPCILTALPHTGALDVARQKREWVAKHLGSVPVITTDTGKHNYSGIGTVLVDDRRGAYEKKWVAAGGVFVHHISAQTTLEEMASVGIHVALAA